MIRTALPTDITLRRTVSLILLVVFGMPTTLAAADDLRVDCALPRSTPESQGVSSDRIIAFVEAADQTVDTMHSFMLVRHGRVVAEGWWSPEAADKPHILWSLSKSFTATAVGLAVAEGKLEIDDKVLDFFPEDAGTARPCLGTSAARIPRQAFTAQ
jgi:CubicO group peptidase (beta-lactamase class C family)